MRLRPYRLIDGTLAADVHLKAPRKTALCTRRAAHRLTRPWRQRTPPASPQPARDGRRDGSAALRLTVDYMKTRQQFGRAIGENQAPWHWIAEMLVARHRACSTAAAVAVRDGGFAKAQTCADLHRAKPGRQQRAHRASQRSSCTGHRDDRGIHGGPPPARRVHVLDQQFGDGVSRQPVAEDNRVEIGRSVALVVQLTPTLRHSGDSCWRRYVW